jgi:hypothetical protein
MVACKGRKKDGTPCNSSVVLENGYCHWHQDQAPEAETLDVSGLLTRERLKAMIAAHGGPEELDLAGAYLSGLDLSGMDLHGIILSHWGKGSWSWLTANLEEANLQGVNLQGASLRGVNLHSAKLPGGNLQGADLALTNLQEVDLWKASLQGADLRAADLRGIDLQVVSSGGLLGVSLYRAKLDHTLLKREQLGSAIMEEQEEQYRRARDTYLALKKNFEDLGDYDAASWAYIKERQMEKKCSAPWQARRFYGQEQLGDTDDNKLSFHHPRVWWFFARHTAKWLMDWLVELICGYGERPWQTVAAMTLVFAVFTGIYWLTWAVLKVDESSTAIIRRSTRNLVDLTIFSLGAFTTMDPKGLEPAATWVQFVTGIEALLGIGLTGLLGFVVGNRIRRS